MANTNVGTARVAALEEDERADGFLEYMGEEPHGTAFLQSHTIPKGDGLWKRNKVSMSKDLVWERDPTGPSVGQKGNRFLLPLADVSPEAVDVLVKMPNYKRVDE
jgi:hypothetical protein